MDRNKHTRSWICTFDFILETLLKLKEVNDNISELLISSIFSALVFKTRINRKKNVWVLRKEMWKYAKGVCFIRKKSYSRKGHYSQTWKVRFLTGFKKKEYSPSSYNFPNKITSRIKIWKIVEMIIRLILKHRMVSLIDTTS